MFDFVTIINGRVTVLTLGASSIPMSTSTTLYWDVTGMSPQPAVNWYFSEPCSEFSETAPVIPPGEIAPPFVPGGTPPDPDDPLTPEVLEPGPPRLALLGYHHTAFHATSADSVTVAGVTPLFDFYGDVTVGAEVNARWRTTFNFAETCGVRLQAHVVTADDVRLVALGSLDGGATWAYLNDEYEGPFLRITDTGEAVGPFVNLDPAFQSGDVLVSVFAVSGPSVSTTLGNVHAMSALRTDDGECPIYIVLTECAVPVAALATDWTEYSTIADLYADAFGAPGNALIANVDLDSASDPRTAFDATKTFNGHKSLTREYADANTSTGIILSDWLNFSGFGGPADLTYFVVYDISAGWSPNETAIQAFGDGNQSLLFAQCWPSSGIGLVSANFAIWGNNVYLVTADFAGSPTIVRPAPILVGPLSDFIGSPKQLILRCERTSSTNLRFSLYVDPPCTTPTLYFQTNVTTINATANMQSVELAGSGLGTVDRSGYGAAAIWVHQVAMDTTASVFGL